MKNQFYLCASMEFRCNIVTCQVIRSGCRAYNLLYITHGQGIGPQVPKLVFMTVCFETHCHAKRLVTFSVGSPPTKILLKI